MQVCFFEELSAGALQCTLLYGFLLFLGELAL